ncbi:MAG: hypothetical protein ACKOEW_06675, partial [Methylocystis sp.]
MIAYSSRYRYRGRIATPYAEKKTSMILAALRRKKSIGKLQEEAKDQVTFRRVLGLWQLVGIGLGGLIGVGIFILTG